KHTKPKQQPQAKPRVAFTEDYVAQALKACGGNYSDAARYLATKHVRTCASLHRPALRGQQRALAASGLRDRRGLQRLRGTPAQAEDRARLRALAALLHVHQAQAPRLKSPATQGGPLRTQAEVLDLSTLPNDALVALAQMLDTATSVAALPARASM